MMRCGVRTRKMCVCARPLRWFCVQLGDGEDVLGEPAPQSNHELIHVGEPGQRHKRDEGVGAQEHESVAGVVLVVIGRDVVAVGPHIPCAEG